MSDRKSRTGRWLLGIAGGAALGLMANGATAAVSASLVAGTTCPGTSSAAFTPGGATQAVTLCITSDVNVCGGTYILRAASGAENDAFRVTARSLVGSVMTDPNTASITFPVSIVAAGTIDFGATSPSAASQPPATNLPVATFTIAPQASATNSSYVISLIRSGVTSTATDCTSFQDFGDNAIDASFTFFQPPTITVAVSPASVAENSGTALVYTFTASAASTSATAITFTPPAASSRYSTDCTSPISLPAAATTVTCSVTPLDNDVLDGSATATVTLLPSAGLYTVGAPSVATGTITDEDVGMGVVASTPSIVEGGTAIFTISCAGQGIATVDYSFSGSYTPLPGEDSVVMTCGTPVAVNVPTFDDAVVNGTRTITLCIDSVGPEPNVAASLNQNKRLAGKALVIDPAQQCATVNIQDNDRPNIIPTMNTLGLMLLGLLLAAAAGFGIRRKA